jgi:hypothetical protein
VTDVTDKSLGQLAFEAYRAAGEPTTYDGKPIPEWDELHGDRAKVHAKWQAAAERIAQHTRMMAALDEAMKGPFVRRPRPTRWEPLSVPQAAEPGATVGEGAGTPLPPVGADVAAAARESVPVAADDDDA